MKQNLMARWGALAVAAVVAVPAFAQDRVEKRTEETTTQERRTTGDNALVREARPGDMPAVGMVTPAENDRRITRWLAIDCKALTECAKMARQQASNADLKAFAETLVADHTKCCDELCGKESDRADTTRRDANRDRAAYVAPRDGEPRTGLQDTTPDKRRTAVVVTDDGKSRDGRVVFRPTDFLSVKEDVCNRVQDIAKKEWEGVTGAEFDRNFLKHQVLGHEMLIASMRAVRPTASSELQAKLDRGIETMTRHLETARKMCEQHRTAKS